MNKFVVVALCACLTVAYGVPAVSAGYQHSVDVLPLDAKEARLIEAPTIGALIWKAAKAACYLIKSGWSLVGLKVGAIALIANLVIWGLKHFVTIIVGAVGMFGFCKLTGKCDWAVARPVYDVIEDGLMYAARNLAAGNSLYEADELPY